MERVGDRIAAMKLLLVLAVFSGYACAQKAHVYPLFRGTETLFTENETVTCDETWVGDNLLLLCRDNRNDREMFHLKIGDRHAKYQDYGISDQGDFNGDGKPDFALYAGNGGPEAMYIELSSGKGYTRVNVSKTVNQFLALRHLGRIELSELHNIRLLRNSPALSLSAWSARTHTQITIPAAEFVMEERR